MTKILTAAAVLTTLFAIFSPERHLKQSSDDRSSPMITSSIERTQARSDDCTYTKHYARCSMSTWKELERQDILAKVRQ